MPAMLLLTYKTLTGEAPGYLSELVYQPYSLCSVRSLVTPNDLYLPKYNLEFMGLTAFKVAAPRLWNELPETVKNASSVASFKKLLKTHLFRQSFS